MAPWVSLRVIVAAVVLTVSVVGGSWLVARPDGQGTESRAAPPETREDQPSRPERRVTPGLGEAELDAEVAELLAFIEEVRGLETLAPVDVVLQDDEAFLAGLLDDVEFEEEIEGVGDTIVALGLADPGFDLEAEVTADLEGTVVGYYDPEMDRLFVRGTEVTPFLRMTLVHELVHALQDQHFGLDEIEEIDDDEAAAGAAALVEGDAEWVATQFLLELSESEQIALFAEIGDFLGAGAFTDDAPDVVDALLGFPYLHGPAFVDALVTERGLAGLDAAYAGLPRSSEQILHPDAYFSDEGPRTVASVTTPTDPVDSGVVGEYLLWYLLDPSTSEAGAAARAAEGWGGDAYATWRDGDRVRVRVEILMDTERDRRELFEALSGWSLEHGSATVVDVDGRIVVEAERPCCA